MQPLSITPPSIFRSTRRCAALAAITTILASSVAAQQIRLEYASRIGPRELNGTLAVTPTGDLIVATSGDRGAYPITSPSTATTDKVHWLTRLSPTQTSGPVASTPSMVYGVEQNGFNRPHAVIVAPNGDVYTAGPSLEHVPGTPGAFDPTANGGRASYIARFDADTGETVAFSYFGNDQVAHQICTIQGLAAGPNGTIAATGLTDIQLPTTSNAWRQDYDGSVATPFVAVFNADLSDQGGPDGTGLLYCSYLPSGDHYDAGLEVEIDANGHVYVVVNTNRLSSGHPTAPFSGAAEPLPGGNEDMYLVKIDPMLSGTASLRWATWLGGSGADGTRNLAIDSGGNCWVVGITESNDLPGATNALQGRSDAFLARFDPDGARIAARYYGGSKEDIAFGIGFGPDYAVIGGNTLSDDLAFPPYAYDTTHNSRRKEDVFVARFDLGMNVIDGTYLGGSAIDFCTSFAVDAAGAAYVAGRETSADFPTTTPSFETVGFTAKISFEEPVPTPGVTVTPTAGLTTDETGAQAQFTVVLDAEPTAPVTIAVTSLDPGEGTTDVASLVFDATDWNVARTVTVTGIDDPDPDGAQAYTVELAPAVSADPAYMSLDPTDVSVTNVDDDLIGVVVAAVSQTTLGLGTQTALEVTGSGFAPGATVAFEGGTGRSPSVTNVTWLDPATLAVVVEIASKAKSDMVWDLRVTNIDGGTGVLQGAVTVVR